MSDLDEPATTRLHYRAQTVDRRTPDRIRVAFWVGPAECEDDELRKVGELTNLTKDEWRAIGALFRGYDKWVRVDGSEGGEWNWSQP